MKQSTDRHTPSTSRKANRDKYSLNLMKQINETVAVSLSKQNLSNLLQNHQAGATVALSQASYSVQPSLLISFKPSTLIPRGRPILHSSMIHSNCFGSKAFKFLHSCSKIRRLWVFQGSLKKEQGDLTQMYMYSFFLHMYSVTSEGIN